MTDGLNFEVPKVTYQYKWDTDDFPESLKLQEYVNGALQEITELKEDLLTRGVVELLRARGYTVIEPKEEDER